MATIAATATSTSTATSANAITATSMYVAENTTYYNCFCYTLFFYCFTIATSTTTT